MAALVAVPLVAAVTVALVAGRGSSGDADPPVPTADLQATDTLTVGSLDDLVAAATCVAAGEVVHTERGRIVTDGLETRLVQVRVDEALTGDCPEGNVVLEEEGWLTDGTEVTVNGWPGSAEGDRGVWFLVPGTSDEMPYAATVATSGALRWRGGELLAPPDPPAWVAAATAGGLDELRARVRETAPPP